MATARRILPSPLPEKAPRGLRGKRAIVVGGSRGVGAATARLLGEQGCSLLVIYRTHGARAAAVIERALSCGASSAKTEALDVSDAADRLRFSRIAAAAEPVDLLVICSSGGMEIGADAAYAGKINTEAPAAIVLALLDRFSPGATIIYVTSHEAHFFRSGSSVPYPTYVVIAQTKREGEDALLCTTVLPRQDAV